MRQEEARRLTVISKVIDGHFSVAQAAEYLQLSIRQVLRIKKRVLEEGEAGVMHKNRGRQPSHTLPQSLKQKIVALYQSDDYRGCNDTHFTELLSQRENLYVSTSTFGVSFVQPAFQPPANIAHLDPIARVVECPKRACYGKWMPVPSTG